MLLTDPVEIAPNLEAGLRVGTGDWITIAYVNKGRRNEEGRTEYVLTVLYGGKEYKDDTLKSGGQGGTLYEGLTSGLSFLIAAAESLDACERHGEPVTPDDNASMFPLDVVRWASEHLSTLEDDQFCLSERPNCIVEHTNDVRELPHTLNVQFVCRSKLGAEQLLAELRKWAAEGGGYTVQQNSIEFLPFNKIT